MNIVHTLSYKNKSAQLRDINMFGTVHSNTPKRTYLPSRAYHYPTVSLTTINNLSDFIILLYIYEITINSLETEELTICLTLKPLKSNMHDATLQ